MEREGSEMHLVLVGDNFPSSFLLLAPDSRDLSQEKIIC